VSYLANNSQEEGTDILEEETNMHILCFALFCSDGIFAGHLSWPYSLPL
jgi:hypothetical protein